MEHIPCIVFLPKKTEERINLLQSLFGSEVKIQILKKFCDKEGVKEKIYQKNLIKSLDYSNKTIIHHIKELVRLEVLKEGMEKKTNWSKYLKVAENMQWLILLLHDPEKLEDKKMRESIETFAKLYLAHLKKLVKQYGIEERYLL